MGRQSQSQPRSQPLEGLTLKQVTRFLELLCKMGLSADDVKLILGVNRSYVQLATKIAELAGGEFLFPGPRLNNLLPTLSQQAATISVGLEKFGKGLGLDIDLMRRFDLWLDKIDFSALETAQAINDCKVVIAWLGDLRNTVRFYQMLVEDQRVAIGLSTNWFFTSFDELPMELDATAWQGYGTEPGIYIAEGVNLLDNWDPENGSSVDQARADAEGKEDYFLASVEALAFYATADPELYRLQDGNNFPYYAMAGIRSGDDLSESPLSCYTYNCRIGFGSGFTKYVVSVFASPSLRGVSRP